MFGSSMQLDLESTLATARAIAKEAGAHALSGFRTGTTIHKKGRIDLVTKFDLECEKLIRARLGDAFPTHRIVGEEQEATGEGELVWYVDPIDGTTNFAHGHPFFCVSMALWRGDEPLVAVIEAPALAVTWSGATGLGATRNAEVCRVSTTEVLGDALCGTGFAYNRVSAVDDNIAEHKTLLAHTRGVRRCGAAALDLALVADGTYDVYWEQGLKPWDVAAGILLVREAGGTITDYAGGTRALLGGQLIAATPRLHGDAHALVLRARRESGVA
jgi:myo-inositol-1(or 4)-monophosphatase